ncbi:nuclear transport factor 2 family protein [Robiginitalea sp. M366]|uniref:nuclear transport factor 2 family protein n=1 Tax=Robiginitalea aestuariiviva TaxID=3036903 RepID=UPI00240E75A8|nr:nuclear transport factor 2 family protein [Robiginitalea aestuariiviva]MDG1572421.1 nuclear transport factor 2 family protein [Robiginitalea aestuariiviva]
MKILILAIYAAALLVACQSPKPEPETSSLADRARIMYADFEQGNIEAVVAGWDPAIVWNEAENFIYADGNPYIGSDAILKGVFGRIGEDWDGFRLEEATFHNVDSNAVLVMGRYRGLYKPTGVSLDAQFAHVWKFRDTLAISFQQYTDTFQAQEVARVPTAADMPD